MNIYERNIRWNVRNWACGLTEAECHTEIANWYDNPMMTLNVKAMIEWCCEGDFWTSSL